MVRYYGRPKLLTSTLNTNQIGLKMSGGSSSVGSSISTRRAVKRRVRDNLKFCGPVYYHGQLWSHNLGDSCVKKAPKNQSLAGGVGRINNPRTKCNIKCSYTNDNINKSTALNFIGNVPVNWKSDFNGVVLPIPEDESTFIKNTLVNFKGGFEINNILNYFKKIKNGYFIFAFINSLPIVVYDDEEDVGEEDLDKMQFYIDDRKVDDHNELKNLLELWNKYVVTRKEKDMMEMINYFYGVVFINININIDFDLDDDLDYNDTVKMKYKNIDLDLEYDDIYDTLLLLSYIISDKTIYNLVFRKVILGDDNILPISKWNVENVTNMEGLFSPYMWGLTVGLNVNWDAIYAFNGDISSWNVENVEYMNVMFSGATSFNGDISSWNVENVSDMAEMFLGATSFNGDISSWNVENVVDMSGMFSGATSFNGDISSWNVENVSSSESFADGATSFVAENQPIFI
jgi:surface protein